jgi:hypothetical protein
VKKGEIMDDNTDAPLQPDQTEDKGKDTQDPSDALTPDHPRFKDVIRENHDLKSSVETLQSQLKDLEARIDTRQEESGDDNLTSDEKEALEKIDRQLKQKGYLTRAEFQQEQRTSQLANDFSYLADRIDGTDGNPKFVPEDVAVYAEENDFPLSRKGLVAAYKEMHSDTIISNEAKKLAGKPTPPDSERPTGRDHQMGTEFTPEKIAEMSPEEYEKHRTKILASFKNSVVTK